MNLATFASRAAAASVAGVAGFASYRHITHVALTAGETAAVAYALPLAIDGLIVVATLAMLEDKRNGRSPRVSARWALGFGILATLAANIASAEPTLLARSVAAVPAAAFLLAVEVLSRSGRKAEGSQVEHVAVPARRPVAAQRQSALKRRIAAKQPRRSPEATLALVEQIRAEAPHATHAELATRLGISPRRLRAVFAAAS